MSRNPLGPRDLRYIEEAITAKLAEQSWLRNFLLPNRNYPHAVESRQPLPARVGDYTWSGQKYEKITIPSCTWLEPEYENLHEDSVAGLGDDEDYRQRVVNDATRSLLRSEQRIFVRLLDMAVKASGQVTTKRQILDGRALTAARFPLAENLLTTAHYLVSRVTFADLACWSPPELRLVTTREKLAVGCVGSHLGASLWVEPADANIIEPRTVYAIADAYHLGTIDFRSDKSIRASVRHTAESSEIRVEIAPIKVDLNVWAVSKHIAASPRLCDVAGCYSTDCSDEICEHLKALD